MKKGILPILAGIVVLFTLYCSDTKDKDINDTTVSHSEIQKQINVQNFFNTLPPATTIYEIIQKSKLNYNSDYLNDPVKHKNYSLEKSRALNLGVYGADLSIAATFNQVQESMLFLKCTNYLAQELGISPAFDESTMERLERNKENRDSVLQIVSKAFKKADKIFVENKRGSLSVLMIVGSFVESMYVAGEYGLSKKEDTLSIKKIQELYFQQKESLSYLIELLEMSADVDDRSLLEKLKNIQQIFSQQENNNEQFLRAHEIFTEIKKQIVNVY
ncbi:MAG: hypothetical protein KatS3mg027_2600 [Bacteroidia bacterium]|nr:MAG: hypothetical protein KatS3mg027_2600 [Bacteroidia bacterium]